jgi:anti-anti-sigma factor
LRVHGRIDAVSAPTLLERCALVQHRGQSLVLNLSGVTFLGSSGVGALLMLAEQFKEQGGAVHFAAPSEAVLSVIRLLNLGPYLPFHDSEAAAASAITA